MKKAYFIPALCLFAALGACSSQNGNNKESAVTDTTELTADQNEEIEAAITAASLPYDAEFFLDEANKGAAGDSAKWTATASGLRYTVIKEGNGPKPASPESEVTVHYAGELTDGTPFDNSYSRGEATSFPLNGVIKGWTEGLQLMPTGSVYEFYIPSELAYGEQGRPGIPPSAPLLFKVELISVNN